MDVDIHETKVKGMYTIGKNSFEKLISEDLDWLKKQPDSLEHNHIEMVLEKAADLHFPKETEFYKAENNRLYKDIDIRNNDNQKLREDIKNLRKLLP